MFTYGLLLLLCLSDHCQLTSHAAPALAKHLLPMKLCLTTIHNFITICFTTRCCICLTPSMSPVMMSRLFNFKLVFTKNIILILVHVNNLSDNYQSSLHVSLSKCLPPHMPRVKASFKMLRSLQNAFKKHKI